MRDRASSKPLKLVPWVPPVVSMVEERKHLSMRWGRLLGWLAMGSLGLMWLVILLDVLARIIGNGSSGWESLIVPGMMVAFIGTHILGFASDTLTNSSSEWGMRALTGFWISAVVLVCRWVPRWR